MKQIPGVLKEKNDLSFILVNDKGEYYYCQGKFVGNHELKHSIHL